MNIINAFEFSELLQTAPGISEVQFTVHSGNVITGDHVIPLFFYRGDAGDCWVIDNQPNKPPKAIKLTDQQVIDLLGYQTFKSSNGMDTMGEAYFFIATLHYDSVGSLQHAQKLYEASSVDKFASDELRALQAATWCVIPVLTSEGTPCTREQLDVELSKPANINLSIIKFWYNNQIYFVIGRGFREEVMLELIRFDEDNRQAYFSGIVAGKPVYQRVKLEEVTYRGDYDFLKWVKGHNFDNGDAGHGLWWIRHMGLNLHSASNSLTLKNPHLSVRGEIKTISDNYDTINNRTVIL